jgi:hypothetical protein
MKTEGLRGSAAPFNNRGRRVFAIAALTATVAWLAPAAFAEEYDSGGLEGLTVGDPVGQDGWSSGDVGAYNAANFDVSIADPSAIWGSALGTRALRISNGVTSPGFGNQLQTPSLADAAGETTADAGTTSGGTRQSRLSGSFTFASATQTYQPGLAVGFAPDRGDGARMSSFRITDDVGGLTVAMTKLDESIPDFVPVVLATGLSRTELHTFQFSLDFVDGDNNDVLWVSIDNSMCTSLAQSGSWEQYHRYYAGNVTPVTFTADSLLFRLSGAAQPALLGGGLYLDDVQIATSSVPAMPAPGAPIVTTAPTTSAVGRHVDVVHDPVVTNACDPVTEYTATLTPSGGGAPMVLTSAIPDFDFESVPVGTYSVRLTAANSAGASAVSEASSVTVVAAVPAAGPGDVDGGGGTDPGDTDGADPGDTDGTDTDGTDLGDTGGADPDDELAETGADPAPLGMAALALLAAGFAVRRTARDGR